MHNGGIATAQYFNSELQVRVTHETNHSFKFQLCNHTPPGTQRLSVSRVGRSTGHGSNAAEFPVGIVYGRDYRGI